MHSLRQLFLLSPELFFPPPERRDFGIVLIGAEFLKSIHFSLNGGDFALNPKLLQFPGTTERRAGREALRRDACNEVRLHWI